MTFRIVVLASGSGTLTQAIIDAKESRALDLEIAAIISDKDSEVLQRAHHHHITSHYMPLKNARSEWNSE